MRAPQNRRVYVAGYALSTALGHGLRATWQRGRQGDSGVTWLSRFRADWVQSSVVGEIPDFAPLASAHVHKRDLSNWHARYVLATVVLSSEALAHAGIELTGDVARRTGALVGSALGGLDAYEAACHALVEAGSLRISPFLLPNVCTNVPSGIAGMRLGFSGPVLAPGGACATGNHAIALGARLIQHGDADIMLAGGVEFPLLPPIVAGFQNMNATYKVRTGDRGTLDPTCASRPFSFDPRGFVLAEGGAVLVLAADEVCATHGLIPRAEVVGIGMTSDAHDITKPHAPTIVRCMQEALADAAMMPTDVDVVNCHATSTKVGDGTELACLREVFGERLQRLPITSNKSQLGHSLGAAAAVEAALSIEGMHRGEILPTRNYHGDEATADLDVVTGEARRREHAVVLSNAFGFGGTNCCVVLALP